MENVFGKDVVIMWTVLIFGIGFLAGTLVRTLCAHRKTVGTLWISRADSNENPWIFLELSRGIEDLVRNRRVILEVHWREPPPRK